MGQPRARNIKVGGGRRATLGLGGMGAGALGSLAGGISPEGAGSTLPSSVGLDPSIAAANGTPSLANNTPGGIRTVTPDSNGDVSSPIVNTNTPPQYKVNNPVMDFFLNGGRGRMAANAANLQNQQFQYQSDTGVANTLKVQHDQQEFEKAKLAIQHDNSLDLAAKSAALSQIENQQREHLAVAQQNGIMLNPESEASYQQNTNPEELARSKALATAGKYSAGTSAMTEGAKNVATENNLPALVNTSRNRIQTGEISSQGTLENQPLANAATRADLVAHPAMVNTELNRSGMYPVTPASTVLSVNTRKPIYTSPLQGYTGDMLNQLRTGTFGNTTGGFSGGGQIPIQGQGNPTLPSGLGGQAMQSTTQQQLPAGAIKLPNGSILNADGTITPAQ